MGFKNIRDFRVYLFICLFLFSTSLQAFEIKNIRFAEEKTIEGKSLILNGVGLRKKTIFQVDVYVAGLYLEKKSQNEDEIIRSKELKQVHVVFLRKGTRKQIIDSWIEGFENNCRTQCETLAERLQELNSFMTEVSFGQEVLLTFYDNRTEVSTHGKSRSIQGHDFGEMMLATFIGSVPPSKELKVSMLGAQ